MFTTGQPNPDAPDRNRKDSEPKKTVRKSEFNSLEEFSCWLDLQLGILEKTHKEFATTDSVRSFFQR